MMDGNSQWNSFTAHAICIIDQLHPCEIVQRDFFVSKIDCSNARFKNSLETVVRVEMCE